MLKWKLLPAIIWALIILLLTGLPGTYFPEIQTFWDWLSPDKVVHVCIFTVQMFLVLIAYRTQYLSGNTRLINTLLIILLVTVYALLTEVLQAYVFIGRDGNLYDFLADFVGILIGLLVFNLYKKKNLSKNKRF